MEYIILTPIAHHKIYSLDRFLRNIFSFTFLPKEIVFCSEPEDVVTISKWESKLKRKNIKLVIFTLEPEVLVEARKGSLERIKISREYLRYYFIHSGFQWALWLDSDIIPEVDTPNTLLSLAQSRKSLVVSSEYQGRGEHPWSGIGCTLTKREACTLSHFDIGYLYPGTKNEKHLSEDLCFFAILEVGSPFIKQWTGWQARVEGKFVSIHHEINPGVDKYLSKGDY